MKHKDVLKEYVTLRKSLEQERAELRARLSQIEAALGAAAPTSAAILAPAAPRVVMTDGAPRKKMSAAGRANIIAAQKARWAKARAAKQAGRPAKAAKRSIKLSAAGRANIIAAQKARWAKARAAKATVAP